MKRQQIPTTIPTSRLATHLKKGTYVRLTKLSATVGGIPACPKPIYEPGLWTHILSLPIHYWMEGFLLTDVVEMEFIRLDRRVRDGVIAEGIFASPRICSVKRDRVETLNSVYLIEAVEPFIPGLRS